MIIVITGSREANEEQVVDLIRNWMDRIPEHLTSQRLWHGGCPTGVDFAADHWWKQWSNEDPVVFAADWTGNGKAAGPIRNSVMVDAAKKAMRLDEVYMLAVFAEGAQNRGTWDCTKKAINAGLHVDCRTVQRNKESKDG